VAASAKCGPMAVVCWYTSLKQKQMTAYETHHESKRENILGDRGK
jgi:hypothetical protein